MIPTQKALPWNGKFHFPVKLKFWFDDAVVLLAVLTGKSFVADRTRRILNAVGKVIAS